MSVMNRAIVIFLLLIATVSVAGESLSMEMVSEATSASQKHGVNDLDCGDCPVADGENDHPCHIGHSCHCIGSVEVLTYVLEIDSSRFLPNYVFDYESVDVFGITRPPIHLRLS